MNLSDVEEENELIQIDAMMIQHSISESSTLTEIHTQLTNIFDSRQIVVSASSWVLFLS